MQVYKGYKRICRKCRSRVYAESEKLCISYMCSAVMQVMKVGGKSLEVLRDMQKLGSHTGFAVGA
jgi:hypothetical protein